MLQRIVSISVTAVLLTLASDAIAQSCSLTFPSNGTIVSSPGQGVADHGSLTLGAAGNYAFSYTRTGNLVQNLQLGDQQSGLPTIAPNKTFFYNGTSRVFSVVGHFPAGNCAAPQEEIVLTFKNALGQEVCKRTIIVKCVQAKVVFSFRNSLGGTGTPTDPVRFCGADKPVLIDGSQSQNTSTYAIEVKPAGGGAAVGRALTAPEAASIANFDLRKALPPKYFEGGKSYSVTLKTGPVPSSETKTIAFASATPAFRMKDRTGKWFEAAQPGSGGATGPITACAGSMLVDGSPALCESSYFLTVQESDATWNRTYAYEWGRWFSGEATVGMNLDELIAQYPDGLNPNKPFTLTGTGGMSFKSKPRYFRIGMATGEPAWDTRWLLVRTGTMEECTTGIVRPNDPCPRTDNVPWTQITSELTRLFLSPCIYSELICPFGETERQRVPLPVGPKITKELVWQGTLTGNPLVVDIESQDQIVAGMRKAAAQLAPSCSGGGKKVPVSIDLETGPAPGNPKEQAVYMSVVYACCAK